MVRLGLICLLLTGCFEFAQKQESRNIHMAVEAIDCKEIKVTCRGIMEKDDSDQRISK